MYILICFMKRKNVKKFQFLIVTHVSALTVGVIGATGAELLSLKFSMATLFSTTCMAIIFLQMNRPTKYWALVRIRRQRDKAMQKAKDLETQRIIVQNISNYLRRQCHTQRSTLPLCRRTKISR